MRLWSDAGDSSTDIPPIHSLDQLTQSAQRRLRFRKFSFAVAAPAFLRCAKKIEEEAVELACRKDCNMVCCGHTHSAVAHTERPIAYFNCGCWTVLACTYLTVAGGIVQLCTFHPEMKDSEEHPLPRRRLAG